MFTKFTINNQNSLPNFTRSSIRELKVFKQNLMFILHALNNGWNDISSEENKAGGMCEVLSESFELESSTQFSYVPKGKDIADNFNMVAEYLNIQEKSGVVICPVKVPGKATFLPEDMGKNFTPEGVEILPFVCVTEPEEVTNTTTFENDRIEITVLIPTYKSEKNRIDIRFTTNEATIIIGTTLELMKQYHHSDFSSIEGQQYGKFLVKERVNHDNYPKITTWVFVNTIKNLKPNLIRFNRDFFSYVSNCYVMNVFGYLSYSIARIIKSEGALLIGSQNSDALEDYLENHFYIENEKQDLTSVVRLNKNGDDFSIEIKPLFKFLPNDYREQSISYKPSDLLKEWFIDTE